MSHIKVKILDTMEYKQAFGIQKDIHTKVVETLDLETILIVEHPSVITLGKRGGDILGDNTAEIPIVQTDRGGLATCHNVGQLVVYPIINIKNRKIGVQHFICILLKSIRDVLLHHYHVEMIVSSEQTGLWYQGKKIASIGMRINKGVSYHGIAINVYNDLSIFQMIEPCGFSSHLMSNLISIDGIYLSNFPKSRDDLMKLGTVISTQIIKNIEEESKDN